jgi:hypothetical protein
MTKKSLLPVGERIKVRGKIFGWKLVVTTNPKAPANSENITRIMAIFSS